ncbi:MULTISPECIES: LPS-assembly protein LptD [Halomonadaceae]|uniref:LPS-assembly protein LptD n=1 Tax=Halomonadaceae TaxID=28256 RepID=UPI0015979B8C|nr:MULTISPECIES: LPS-assembly protein LptD [Halomonas]QJQ94779.1 LPS-assembly protein LptD [Halomonas sp. PA5]
MGKRSHWTALAGIMTGSGMLLTPVHAAPPPSPPGSLLDWQAWGEQAPADALCRGRYVMPDYRLAAGDRPGEVRTESDEAHYGADGEIILGGEVILRRDNSQLESTQVRVNAEHDRAFASGPLAIRDQGLLIRGSAAEISLVSDDADVETAHYVLHDQRLRGNAQRLEQIEEGLFRMDQANFTTCDPGDNLWMVVGNDVLIDQRQGFATARHARLEVGEVPVFYWPWVRFPIDDRRHSGFLWPALGLTRGSFDYSQPYYFNLAPNYDATLSPRWIADRGLLLGGEFRYLYPTDAGQIEGAYMVDDDGGTSRNPNDPERTFAGEDRWYVDYRHQGRFSPQVGYNLRYGAASDGRYFEDFGSTFGERDLNYLSRLAQIDYRGALWQLDARAQGYQKLEDPLNDSDKPFYRLPSLSASARWSQDNGFYQQWRSNATYFWRDVDENRVPLREAATGGRMHLSPALGWRASPSWGFLEPRMEMLHTAYELDYGDRDTERSTSLTRTVPVTSIDGGLVFERELDLGQRSYRQTLEPRLNYAYVPARDQREFPDFDSDERAFSWDQLWSPHRFSGADRIGDLNRLSYGAATRFLEDESGRQRLSLAMGQAVYFDDRHIDLNGDPHTLPNPEEGGGERYYQATRSRSPLVTRLDWQINQRWSTGYEWLYDDSRNRTERTTLDLRYRDPRGHVLNLGYRWELEGFDPSGEPEDRLDYNREEYDVSFAYRLNPRLDVIGRYTHDYTNDRALEQLAGVQWNDCCYGLQLVWREWIDDNDTAQIEDDFNDRGIFLRFIFKGLGGVGQEADSYFERTIPGYRPVSF